jgi:hypothetical protein
MPQQNNPAAAPDKIRAAIDLDHRVWNGEDVYAFPPIAGLGGPCDGKADNSSCGPGCTCIAGQPHYNAAALEALGVEIGVPKN